MHRRRLVKASFFSNLYRLIELFPLSLKVDFLNIHTANKHSFSRFIVLIIFKDKKTGKWINFTDEKGWVFSDTLDKDRVPYADIFTVPWFSRVSKGA